MMLELYFDGLEKDRSSVFNAACTIGVIDISEDHSDVRTRLFFI